MTHSAFHDRRVLVTGASGFIGTRLRHALAETGAEIHAVSRQPHAPEHPRERWHEIDLAHPDAARRLVEEVRPDLIYHLASHVSGARERSAVLPTFHANLASTVGLLLAAAEADTERIVLAGSLEEPGAGEHAAVPASPYAAAKAAASAYARMFHALYATPVVIARLYMVYGPGQEDRSKLIPYVTLRLLAGESPRLSSGRREVDWIYVDDVVEGLLALALAPGIEGATLDLGSGTLVPIRDVVTQISGLVDPSVAIGFGALPDRPLEQVRSADVAATTARTGWRPRTSLESGLEQTVAWYREHRLGH